MRFLPALWIGILLAPAVLAQNQSIRWQNQAEPAVQEAKKTKKPILFYVVSRGNDRNEKTERLHRRSWQDPLVIELARNYVCVELSRSRYRNLLEQWAVADSINQEIVVTNPDGEKLGQISDSEIGDPKLFAKSMAEHLKRYRNDLYNKEIKEKLEDPKATPAQQTSALKMVEDMNIAAADNAVVALAKREDVNPAVQKKALDTLVALSTEPAVEYLIELAKSDPKKYGPLLAKCNAGGIDAMLKHLDDEPLELYIALYNALARISKLPGPKPEAFWSGPNEAPMREELERLRKQAEKASENWRTNVAPYR